MEPTDKMCDAARGFILGMNCCDIDDFGTMQRHLDNGGYKSCDYIRNKAKKCPGEYITTWHKAYCIYSIMENEKGAELRKALEEAKKALEFYADKNNYKRPPFSEKEKEEQQKRLLQGWIYHTISPIEHVAEEMATKALEKIAELENGK